VKNYTLKNTKTQAGMTLIELTVVLLILIGLAGLLIPYVGSFVQKTHDSTNSSNLSSLNEAVGRYIAQTNKLPDNLETLTNNAAATTGSGVCSGTQVVNALYCGLLDTTMLTASTYTGAAAPLDTTGANIPLLSLTKAGLSSVHEDDPTAANKTFGAGIDATLPTLMTMSQATTPYTATDILPVAKVAPLSTASAAAAHVGTTVAGHLALALGGHENDYDTTCYDYIAMGIGDHTKMIGTTIAAAPVHFPEDASKGPTDYYNHYVAIIQVDKNNTSAAAAATATDPATKGCSSQTEKAKFVGVAMIVPNYVGSHLFGANQSLGYAYDNNSNK
jgi:type II secretory pathway pseudopilin PulG